MANVNLVVAASVVSAAALSAVLGGGVANATFTPITIDGKVITTPSGCQIFVTNRNDRPHLEKCLGHFSNQNNGNNNTNVNANNVGGGDGGHATAKAYLTSNPKASVGDISTYLRNTLNLETSVANQIATEVKNQQKQNQSQTATATTGTITNTNGGGGNNANRISIKNGSVEFDATKGVSAAAIAPNTCIGEVEINGVKTRVVVAMRSEAGNVVTVNGGGAWGDQNAIQGGFSITDRSITEGGDKEDCRNAVAKALAAQGHLSDLVGTLTVEDLFPKTAPQAQVQGEKQQQYQIINVQGDKVTTQQQPEKVPN